LLTEAKKHAHKYHPDQGEQMWTGGKVKFAKIGPHCPSDAELSQLRRLAAIQKEANETVFDESVQF